MDRATFFDVLWADLKSIAPQAAAIDAALRNAGETVHNDHVAFRTFDRSPVSLSALEPHILRLGYAPLSDYDFPEKHLHARAYLSPGAPRIFVSELLTGELSPAAQAIIDTCLDQVDAAAFASPSCFASGRPWAPVPFSTYEQLAAESEYAAWMVALGYHANHFTVSVNHLHSLHSVEAVLEFVEDLGFPINAAGGRVKGSRAVCLEQGSTLADHQAIEFADGPHVIPTCYTEFAQRHFNDRGLLYEGFVTTSADKIFESTHRASVP